MCEAITQTGRLVCLWRMFKKNNPQKHFTPVILFCLLAAPAMLSIGCQSKSEAPEEVNKADRLRGTWTLVARIVDGQELPVSKRLMRLIFTDKGVFTAEYRSDKDQGWIRPGKGVFRYIPPMLNLYWDSGAVTILLVTEIDQDRILVHHGRNLVPLTEQEPDEIFQRQRPEKGPTQKTG